MAEEGIAAAGDTSSSSRAASSFAIVGDRTRFTVELRPGETTIVSWKKLMKDASRAEGPSTSAAAPPEPPPNAHPALQSRLAPGEPATNELEDAPPPNRFSAVIEKIERLYMGKDSSDEEDLEEIPDDDQYDTEDSFIDDAELDEYFEVDKSKTKHDGFFVNRGKLESIEPLELSHQQPKKRRRKETSGPEEHEHGHGSRKHMKVGRKSAGKTSVSADKNALPLSQGLSVEGSEEKRIQNPSDAFETYPEIAADGKCTLDPASSLKVTNGDALSSLSGNNIDKQRTRIFPEIYSGKNVEESELSIQQRERSFSREQLDLNIPHPMQVAVRSSGAERKEGSSIKPKGNVLEKAIRELEKMVAESRPPTTDVQEADASFQAVKRRLPREIKQKLAKVARLAVHRANAIKLLLLRSSSSSLFSLFLPFCDGGLFLYPRDVRKHVFFCFQQASHGKVPKELLNRLMCILGHLVQLRTLKRNLRIMINMSVSAKQENDDKFQQIKKEVVEMIKARASSLVFKTSDQQFGESEEFQDSIHEDKGTIKGQCSMDFTLEDKICDLYDIFVDGLDEDVAPQVRKLYGELAELWPRGVMDNHGIKRAICRAKERRRALHERKKEKIRRKKLMATKMEGRVGAEPSKAAQGLSAEGMTATDAGVHVATSQNQFSSSSTAAGATVTKMHPPPMVLSMPVPSTIAAASSMERPRAEKLKGTWSSSHQDARTIEGQVVKKKVKRKPEAEVGGGHFLPSEKLPSLESDVKQKSHKHAVIGILQVQAAPQNSNTQTAIVPSFQQPT